MYKDIYIIDLKYKELLEKCNTSHKRMAKIISTVPFKCEINGGHIITGNCHIEIPHNVFNEMKSIAEIPDVDEIREIDTYIAETDFIILYLADLCGLRLDIEVQFIRLLRHSYYYWLINSDTDNDELSIVDRVALMICMTKFYDMCYKIRDRLLSANKKSLELSYFRRMYEHLIGVHPIEPEGESVISFAVGCFVATCIGYDVITKMDIKIEPIENQSITLMMSKCKNILEGSQETDILEAIDLLHKCIYLVNEIIKRDMFRK